MIHVSERGHGSWHHFVERATELESVLGYKLYSSRPKGGMFSSTFALRALYPVLALFWMAAMLWVP